MNDLYIIGGGGFSSEVLFVIHRIQSVKKKWENAHIIDDFLPIGKTIYKHEVLGGLDFLLKLKDPFDVVITINNSISRQSIVNKLSMSDLKVNFPNIIDTSVIYDPNSLTIGHGNIVMHNVVLSTNLQIGNFNIFNSFSGIGHDSKIGSYNTFNPRVAVSGNVQINDLNSFGVNSTILQNKTIGSNNQVWFGSTIVKNVKDDGIYFGQPAKRVLV